MNKFIDTPFIETLGSRSSCAKLTAPAPEPTVLTRIFAAAVKVPDHMHLRPWRFLTIQGDARMALGELFSQAERTKNPTASQDELDKKAAKALRAPLIIVGICSYQQHDKVPLIEQQLSTGCVMHNIGLALHSLNFASIWRTGSFAFDAHINKALGLADNESIVGYLYVGSHEGKTKVVKPIEVGDYFQAWPKA